MHNMALFWPDKALVNPLDAPPAPIFQLTLRRTHLIEDTFRQLGAADHGAFKKELVVNMLSKRCQLKSKSGGFGLQGNVQELQLWQLRPRYS